MFFNAFIANAFKQNSFAQYSKLLLYVLGNLYFIKKLMPKIYYLITLNAPEMVMQFSVWIKTFRFTISLNRRNDPNFSKGQECSVYRIKGDVWKDLPDLVKYGTSTRVIF